jgi:hypothetical protein
MDQINKVIEFALLAIGPCAIVYSFASFFRTRAFLRTSIEVTGQVVRLERSKYPDRYGYTYAPVFCFTANDGTEHTVTSDVGSSPAGFSEGDSVRVRYEPANPQDARIHTFFQTWGTVVISGAVGVLFVTCGCNFLGLLHLAK